MWRETRLADLPALACSLKRRRVKLPRMLGVTVCLQHMRANCVFLKSGQGIVAMLCQWRWNAQETELHLPDP